MSIVSCYALPHAPISIPEIGKGEEQKIKPTLDSYRRVAEDIAQIQPETIVLVSPHSVLYRDYFHISPGGSASGNFGSFGAPQCQMSVDYDEEFVEALSFFSKKVHIPAGTLGELKPKLDHGTMVPLYYINKEYRDYKLVRIGLSGLSLETHKNFGRVIADVAEHLGRRTVLIASGDMSHCQKEDGPYGYQKEGPEYDERVMDIFKRGAFSELLDFEEDFLEKSQECGHRSFVILSGALFGKKYTSETLSHEAVFGVGYGFCTCHVEGKEPPEKEEDVYVQLARRTIENKVKNQDPPDFTGINLTKEMLGTKAGVFVSVHEHGMLRGCIGTIAPVTPDLAEEIIGNAVSAVTRDPRFDKVEEEELPFLEISVDVLSPAEKIDSAEQLDVHRYGVIVEHKDGRRGLLLPDLEGVETVEQQISIARAKAGIREHEPVQLSRFEVVRHG